MGKRIAAKITGVGGYVPPQVLTNADIAKLVDTNDQWIRERTGISERHIVEPGVATSHLATAAAQTVLEKTHTAPEEIDLIIVATVTPDMLFPATACLVQNRIGASRAWGFDLSGACSGFLYALTVGAQFVGAGTHRKALIIGADVMTSIINYEDRSTCVLFGDGAGAVLVEPAAFSILATTSTAREEIACACPRAARCTRLRTRPWIEKCTTCTNRARRFLNMQCGAWRKCPASCSNATDLRTRMSHW
jgi:3-oxoacyl-(acyl-carrier-protein) synthase III